MNVEMAPCDPGSSAPDVGLRYIVIRPRLRIAWMQLLVLIGLVLATGAALFLTGSGPRKLIGYLVVLLTLAAVTYVICFRYSASRDDRARHDTR
jgi:hypothetical protein